MILAATTDTGYKIVLILHILAVIAAMAPAIAHPIMGTQAKGLDSSARDRVYDFMAFNSQRVYGSALILAGILGFGLVGMSGDEYSMSEGWVVAAMIIWVAMVGIVHALLVPAERQMTAGDPAAEQKVRAFGMLLTVAAIVMIYLMVFQPGH